MHLPSLELTINNKKISLKTINYFGRADAAISIQAGDTVLHCVVCTAEEQEYFGSNITVQYKEYPFASGQLQTGLKRDNRISESEILTARIIDRSIRPLIDEYFLKRIAINVLVVSNDGQIATDILAILGCSYLLQISNIPTLGIIGACRVVQNTPNGDFKLSLSPHNLTQTIDTSPFNLQLMVAGNHKFFTMIDAQAKEVAEATMLQGLEFAKKQLKDLISKIEQHISTAQVSNKNPAAHKQNISSSLPHIVMREIIENANLNDLSKSITITTLSAKNHKDIDPNLSYKANKGYAIDNSIIMSAALKMAGSYLEQTEGLNSSNNFHQGNSLGALPQYNHKYFTDLNNVAGYISGKIKKRLLNNEICHSQTRLDQRNNHAVRHIDSNINILPNAHGSGSFSRGSTYCLSAISLLPMSSDQSPDSSKPATFTDKSSINKDTGADSKDMAQTRCNLILNYEFPSFAVGETNIRSSNRREVGHAALAQRGLKPILPAQHNFGYDISSHCIIYSSDGSSSMATVCATSLALMDAGVPIKRHVAGISIGAIKYNNQKDCDIIVDITGTEDEIGEMDFKMIASRQGITAVQMDVKTTCIDILILQKAFKQGVKSVQNILTNMESSIPHGREKINAKAPAFKNMQIPVENIKDVIGSGGRVIKDISQTYKVRLNISQAGMVSIYGSQSNTEEAEGKILEIISKKEKFYTPRYFGSDAKTTEAASVDNSQSLQVSDAPKLSASEETNTMHSIKDEGYLSKRNGTDRNQNKSQTLATNLSPSSAPQDIAPAAQSQDSIQENSVSNVDTMRESATLGGYVPSKPHARPRSYSKNNSSKSRYPAENKPQHFNKSTKDTAAPSLHVPLVVDPNIPKEHAAISNTEEVKQKPKFTNKISKNKTSSNVPTAEVVGNIMNAEYANTSDKQKLDKDNTEAKHNSKPVSKTSKTDFKAKPQNQNHEPKLEKPTQYTHTKTTNKTPEQKNPKFNKIDNAPIVIQKKTFDF